MKKRVLKAISFVLLAMAVSGGCVYLQPLPSFTLTYENRHYDNGWVSIQAEYFGGTYTVFYNIDNPVDNMWVKAEVYGDDFITLLSAFPSSHTNGAIQFKVSENTGDYRSGTIRIWYEAYDADIGRYSKEVEIDVSQYRRYQ